MNFKADCREYGLSRTEQNDEGQDTTTWMNQRKKRERTQIVVKARAAESERARESARESERARERERERGRERERSGDDW